MSQQKSQGYQTKRKMLNEKFPENIVKKVFSDILKGVDDIQCSISSFEKKDALDNYIDRTWTTFYQWHIFLAPEI